MSAERERIAELEAQLQAVRQELAEAQHVKREVLARMSHDLRTPMNAILGYARILLRKLDGQIDARQYQNLQNIQTSAQHLLGQIDEILAERRAQQGEDSA